MNSPPKLHKSLALLVIMARSKVVGSGREAGRVLDHIAVSSDSSSECWTTDPF